MKDINPLIILLVLFILMGLAYGPVKNRQTQTSTSTNTNSQIANGNEQQSSADKNLSPYHDKIRMSGISGLHQDDPNQEYITFFTNLKKDEEVNITGWFLKSEVTGYTLAVGKAALLPIPFNKTESDVILKQGDIAYLTKGFSPVGISFKTNECTGYFQEDRQFYPSLPTDCPAPRDEKLPNFSNDLDSNDECISLIETISRCTTKNSRFIRDLPDTITNSCKTYITTQINYNACVTKHLNDEKFAGSEYRLFFNRFGPLWRKTHDKINLYDQNGLLVGGTSY